MIGAANQTRSQSPINLGGAWQYPSLSQLIEVIIVSAVTNTSGDQWLAFPGKPVKE